MARRSEQRYTVAVDFDGVLHQYTTPWINAETIPDPPIPGAIEWINEIAQHFDVVIFTTRGKTAEGRRAVGKWLDRYGANWFDESFDQLVVTAEKPAALVYIDDRAWRFEGRFPTKDEIHRARPYRVARS